jgi:hypothetical protein
MVRRNRELIGEILTGIRNISKQIYDKLSSKYFMNKEFTDRHGMVIRKGDTVKLLDIPLGLLLGRTESEQNALREAIGNRHLVQSYNQHGKIELEFYDARGIPHTIFINPACVTRIPG